MKFALAGNPNCGKTTLFNQLTGSTAHVGNWPGVTVDKREGTYKKLPEKVQIVDLPGIYSLSPYTPEEIVSRNFILDEKPDAIINIVDATNLERNLYLTTQILEMDVPVIIALNMIDVVEKNGDQIVISDLEKTLNVPVVSISALKGKGTKELMEKAYEAAKKPRQGFSVLSESPVGGIVEKVTAKMREGKIESPIFHAVKLIEKDEVELEMHADVVAFSEALKKDAPKDAFDGDYEAVVADARYTYINKHFSGTVKKANKADKLTRSDKIDKVLTHRVWSIPIFLLIMLVVFHFTFSSDFLLLNGVWGVNTAASEGAANFFCTTDGAYFEAEEEGETLELVDQDGNVLATYEDGDFIQPVYGTDGKAYVEGEDGLEEYEYASAGVPSLGVFLQSWLGVLMDDVIIGNIQTAMENAEVADWATGLICDGILSGLSAILSFLPQILLLFLFLSILEDSGYMARVAFIMDRAFRKLGLSGKAFMPLIMCFGCGVPGAMATKTLENEKERRMTLMVSPFFSCGAKLPIWLAFGGILFAGQFGDLVVFSMYLIGIVVAILAAILLKATVMKGETPPFIMELPAYHLPQFKNLMLHLWEKLKHFLFKAATIIAGSIVVIWFLSNFGFAFWNGMVDDIEVSILGRIGNVLKYIFYPLGFGMGDDGWKFVVASFTGLIAKEEVISTMEVLAGSAGFEAMVAAMGAPEAYSFMVFNLLAIPCMAMVGAVAGEMSKGKYTWGAIGFWLGTAYVVSAVTYWFGMLCELSWVAGLIVGLIVVAAVVTLCVLKAKGIIGKKQKAAEAA